VASTGADNLISLMTATVRPRRRARCGGWWSRTGAVRVQTLARPANTAIQKYLNARGVPQLFVATGATKWGDPQNFA